MSDAGSSQADLEHRLQDAFPFLREADPALRQALLDRAAHTELSAGTFISMEGDRCAHLPLVLSGTARVYKIGGGGREITLYRITPGESCILTASCVLSDRPFPAFAETASPVEVLAVSADVFQEWFEQHPAWRSYVFDLLARRLAAVIELVEEVSFHHLDARLAGYLLQAATPLPDSRSTTPPVVRRTHQSIAADLGTSREVVSRTLKDFEHQHLVEVARGAVYVRDADGLRRRARD